MKRVASILIAILVLLLVGTWFYAGNVSRWVNPDGETYAFDDKNGSGSSGEITFKDGYMYTSEHNDKTGEWYDITFKYGCYGRPRYFFNTYFQGKSILSLRKAEYPGIPADLIFIFQKGEIGDSNGTYTLTEEDYPKPIEAYVYFDYDNNCLWFDNICYKQVKEAERARVITSSEKADSVLKIPDNAETVPNVSSIVDHNKLTNEQASRVYKDGLESDGKIHVYLVGSGETVKAKNSSSIRSMTYYDESDHLIINISGKEYVFANVSSSLWKSFKDASSSDDFYDSHMKGNKSYWINDYNGKNGDLIVMEHVG